MKPLKTFYQNNMKKADAWQGDHQESCKAKANLQYNRVDKLDKTLQTTHLFEISLLNL